MSWLKGDEEGELVLGACALGRRYIVFEARERSRKLSLFLDFSAV